MPAGQRLIFVELLVPPMNAVLMQPAAELLADAKQLLLVRLLEAQSFCDKFRI